MLSGQCKSCTHGRGCRKRDYPVNTEHDVTPRTRLCTMTVSWWRKLNQPTLSTRVRDETAETPGEPARRQVRRHRACEVERPLYDPGAKKEYRNKF